MIYFEWFNFVTEYIEDICPYATFQLNKQTYSESSYSGNVYSGPYHSVRGSFVYHDAKPDGSHVSLFLSFHANRLTLQFLNCPFCFGELSPRNLNIQRLGEKEIVYVIHTPKVKV